MGLIKTVMMYSIIGLQPNDTDDVDSDVDDNDTKYPSRIYNQPKDQRICSCDFTINCRCCNGTICPMAVNRSD